VEYGRGGDVTKLPSPERMQQVMVDLRRRWVLVLASLPYFLTLVLYLTVRHLPLVPHGKPIVILGMIDGALTIMTLTRASECTDLGRSLLREPRTL